MILAEDGEGGWPTQCFDLVFKSRIISLLTTARGLGGWVVVVEGDPYDLSQKMTFLMVKRLGEPACSFEEASFRFEALRTSPISQTERIRVTTPGPADNVSKTTG
jgi:hypothetical protein